MNPGIIIGLVNLFCAGLLAGEEFTIRYGVRGPLASLDTPSSIRLRQALILRLRVLVPILFVLTVLSGIAVIIVNGFDGVFVLRGAGLLALAIFIGVTITGTVPINQAALTWDPAAPPANWQTLIKRWEQLDTIRCWLALIAFAFFLVAIALP